MNCFPHFFINKFELSISFHRVIIKTMSVSHADVVLNYIKDQIVQIIDKSTGLKQIFHLFYGQIIPGDEHQEILRCLMTIIVSIVVPSLLQFIGALGSVSDLVCNVYS